MDQQYIDSIDSWHTQRLESLTSETGWLTLAGLHRLEDGSHTIGTGDSFDITIPGDSGKAIGTLILKGDSIRFVAAEDARVTVDGELVTDRSISSDRDSEPTVLETGSVLAHVIERTGMYFLRVRDRESVLLKAFDGVDRFPVDQSFRVEAVLDTSRASSIEITNALGNLETNESPGVLTFTLQGTEVELKPTASSDGSLFIVFGDETNGDTTYGAGRFLSADAPDQTGTVVLDFNRSFNMVCAFSPHAACPFPPAGNRIPIAITAGEMTPTKHEPKHVH